MKKILITMAMLLLTTSAALADNMYCTLGGQTFYAVRDNLGYAIAFNVNTTRSPYGEVGIYYTPGDTYFNVDGEIRGVKLSASVALSNEYPQQGVLFGIIKIQDTALQCNYMK